MRYLTLLTLFFLTAPALAQPAPKKPDGNRRSRSAEHFCDLAVAEVVQVSKSHDFCLFWR